MDLRYQERRAEGDHHVERKAGYVNYLVEGPPIVFMYSLQCINSAATVVSGVKLIIHWSKPRCSLAGNTVRVPTGI